MRFVCFSINDLFNTVWLVEEKKMAIYTSMALLYVLSTPIIAGNFFKLIEGTEPRKTPTEMPSEGAIVLLSGMISQINLPMVFILNE